MFSDYNKSMNENGVSYHYANPEKCGNRFYSHEYDLVDLYAEPQTVTVEKIVEVHQPMTESDKAALELGRAMVKEHRTVKAREAAIEAKNLAELELSKVRAEVEKLFDDAIAAAEDPLGTKKAASCGVGCCIDEEE